LRRLKPLPQSAYELCDIAQRLGIDHPDQVVYLGSRATETAVKAMSEDGTLGRYQIVYFSTHGLLAGEIDAEGEQHRSGQLHEAGLVLTPPEKAGEEDDGLLTASEIAQLRLNAEWVVLSACNTAAGDRPGTQALSGLAKAYFYAGARTLLVSHWGVYASAASELGTKTFAELHANKGISKAEALRRSMAELFNSKRPSDIAIARGDTDRAHPTYWAPFILVGDGR
jgi:CHAT domain-containing protein